MDADGVRTMYANRVQRDLSVQEERYFRGLTAADAARIWELHRAGRDWAAGCAAAAEAAHADPSAAAAAPTVCGAPRGVRVAAQPRPPLWQPDEHQRWRPPPDSVTFPRLHILLDPLSCLDTLAHPEVVEHAGRALRELHYAEELPQRGPAHSAHCLTTLYLFGGVSLTGRVLRSRQSARSRSQSEPPALASLGQANGRLVQQLQEALPPGALREQGDEFVAVLAEATGSDRSTPWSGCLLLLLTRGRLFAVDGPGAVHEVCALQLLRHLQRLGSGEGGAADHPLRLQSAAELFGSAPPAGSAVALAAQRQEYLPEPLNRRLWRMLRWAGAEWRAARLCLERQLAVDHRFREQLPPLHCAVVRHEAAEAAALAEDPRRAIERDGLWGFTAAHMAVLFGFEAACGSSAGERAALSALRAADDIPDARFHGTPRQWRAYYRYQCPRGVTFLYYNRSEGRYESWGPADFERRCGAIFVQQYLAGHDYALEVLLQMWPVNDRGPKYAKLIEAARRTTGDDNLILADLGDGVGFGVFARKCFEPGDYICTYFGEVVSDRIFAETDDDSPGQYSMTMPGEIDGKPIDFRIDARRCRNLGGMVNHSQLANAHTDAFVDRGAMVVVMVAQRRIERHEQVCIDYRWEGAEAMSEMLAAPLGQFPRSLDVRRGVSEP
eukprot:TRINITY_DN24807_c0_g1_i1.p1 TRINITY_DN24807_c0_g1~~TRINITY_DN24807_c0_g1_i1.p1  ORF type:complete len:701 (+),score=175.54 TRINITY_DN24807_c0_g1_i1:105-2105(+)